MDDIQLLQNFGEEHRRRRSIRVGNNIREWRPPLETEDEAIDAMTLAQFKNGYWYATELNLRL
jgi:hypothetical protein